MKKIWEYIKGHKLQATTTVVLIICAVIYAVTGQNLDPQPFVDKICTIIGC